MSSSFNSNNEFESISSSGDVNSNGEKLFGSSNSSSYVYSYNGADEIKSSTVNISPIYYNKELIDKLCDDSILPNNVSPQSLYGRSLKNQFKNHSRTNSRNSISGGGSSGSRTHSRNSSIGNGSTAAAVDFDDFDDVYDYDEGNKFLVPLPPPPSTHTVLSSQSTSNLSIFVVEKSYSELPSQGSSSSSPSSLQVSRSSSPSLPLSTSVGASPSSFLPSIGSSSRSHKRFHSTSSPSLTSSNHETGGNHSINSDNNNTTPPSLKSNLAASANNISQSLSSSFGTISSKISQSPFKSKLLKVITNVKNSTPVESILTNLSISSSTLSPRNSSSDISQPTPTSESLPTYPSHEQQEQKKEEVKETNDGNNNNIVLKDSIDNIVEEFVFDMVQVDKDQESTQNNCHNNNIVHFEKQQQSMVAVSHVVENSVVQTNGRSSLLHLSYKSTLLNQISQQQSRSERYKFSLPLLDISPYPKLSSENENNRANPTTNDISYDSLYDCYKSGNNTYSYPSLKASSNSVKDITLQRFKPLPLLPPTSSNQSLHQHQHQHSNQHQNQQMNQNNKMSSLLQFISISLPDIITKTGDSNGNNTSSATLDDDQYRTFSQYLNESGDRHKIFQHIQWHLDQPTVNVEIVKLLGTHYGFTDSCRAISWMLMTGYLPANKEQRQSVLHSKKLQYRDLVKKYYGDCKQFESDENNFERNTNKLLSNVAELWSNNTQAGQLEKEKFNELVQQVHIDVIRTRPDGFCDLFELKEIEQMSERILVIWSSENKDVSYFQGLNDLICPFLIVFLDYALELLKLSEGFPSYPSLIDTVEDEVLLSKRIGDGLLVKELVENKRYDILSRVETDVYWCLSNLMNSCKSYAANTGCGLPAEGMMKNLESLIKESNEELYLHFKKHGLDFSHFSFRWMVCFLIRELSFETGIKLWDRYMCDKNNEGFSILHICFCASLLSYWSNDLLNMEFMGLVTYLQRSDILPKDQLDPILRSANTYRQIYNYLL